jgi:hypothetical protein
MVADTRHVSSGSKCPAPREIPLLIGQIFIVGTQAWLAVDTELARLGRIVINPEARWHIGGLRRNA